MRFTSRFDLHNIKTTGGTASADKAAAEAYPEELEKMIKEGGYDLPQVFNVDETGLFWKKLASRAYISGEKKWHLD